MGLLSGPPSIEPIQQDLPPSVSDLPAGCAAGVPGSEPSSRSLHGSAPSDGGEGRPCVGDQAWSITAKIIADLPPRSQASLTK